MRKVIFLAALAGLVAPAPAHAGIVQKIFQRIAQKKQDRVFHAQGVAYRATFFRDNKAIPAIVRLSRGGATKDPTKPDIEGVAIKVLDPAGDQDFLMVTAKGMTGFKSRLAKFSGAFAGEAVSSLTSFKYGPLKGVISTTLPEGFRTPLDLQAPGVGAPLQSFQLGLRQGGGLFSPLVQSHIGQVTVDFRQQLSAEEAKALRMTPFHQSMGVKPVGIINWLRSMAYPGSQSGRGLADEKLVN